MYGFWLFLFLYKLYHHNDIFKYHNMSGEKKQKLKEHQKKYSEANKSRKSAKSRNLIKNCITISITNFYF